MSAKEEPEMQKKFKLKMELMMMGKELKEWKFQKHVGIVVAILGKFIVLLEQVVDVVPVTIPYVVAMVYTVADMDHAKRML